jgi:hypothetical protein
MKRRKGGKYSRKGRKERENWELRGKINARGQKEELIGCLKDRSWCVVGGVKNSVFLRGRREYFVESTGRPVPISMLTSYFFHNQEHNGL